MNQNDTNKQGYHTFEININLAKYFYFGERFWSFQLHNFLLKNSYIKLEKNKIVLLIEEISYSLSKQKFQLKPPRLHIFNEINSSDCTTFRHLVHRLIAPHPTLENDSRTKYRNIVHSPEIIRNLNIIKRNQWDCSLFNENKYIYI